ncbi:MAG TPA: hypothetical protein VL336_06015 [Sphingomicrobium sp.]|jgi:hypothetical protein|nr:hypothetical protein [Sphingomicrobium sp.]
MILALLLAAAEPPMSAIDAERAFVADAQKLGQWTAFRKYAADDAVMFVPQQVNAQQFLKGRNDPPASVYWWPGKSFVSCDGSYAVNTGPWVRQYGKAVGFFTTVWKRQADGSWKWIYDGGDGLDTARAEGGDIKPNIAACSGEKKRGFIATPPAYDSVGGGKSGDNSLIWRWSVSAAGALVFEVWLWNGRTYDKVLTDDIKAS